MTRKAQAKCLTLSVVMLAAFGLAGCNTTQHVPYGARDEKALNLDRTVEVQITGDFYQEAPECVTVLPVDTNGEPPSGIHIAVEDSIARYMRMKMTRVIDRLDRQVLERQLAVDLSHNSDRRAYARATRCRHFIRIRPWGSGNQYLVFWSRESIGVEASLVGIENDTPLWKARHVASRSDGGLPFNPFSALFNAYEANALSADGDVPLSLADDVARHIVATLPGMRRSTLRQNKFGTQSAYGGTQNPYGSN